MATTNEGIYYPGDYTLEADVPEDMRKMAISVEELMKKNIKLQRGKIKSKYRPI